MPLTQIEDAFVTAASGLSGVGYVAKNIPAKVPSRLPAVMLTVTQMPTDDFQVTGPLAQVTWAWDILVWVELRSDDAWEAAQEAAKTFLPQILALPRANRTLSGTVENWAVFDQGGRFTMNEQDGYLEKTLSMTATAEESWTP